MTPQQFLDMVRQHPAVLQYPVLLRGATATGKSSAVYQLAESLNREVVEIRVSQYTEGDLTGIPRTIPIEGTPSTTRSARRGYTRVKRSTPAWSVPTRATAYAPPWWLVEASTKGVVLFFDEIGRGNNEVRMAIMQLIDSRVMLNLALHEETIIIAADNSGPGAIGSYHVHGLDPAELSRYVVFDIEITKSAWAEWAAASGIDARIRGFVAETVDIPAASKKGERANPSNPQWPLTAAPVSGTVGPTPRNWERLSVLLQDLPSDSPLIPDLACGTVGKAAGMAFAGYIERHRFIRAQDVIEGKVDIDALFTGKDPLRMTETVELAIDIVQKYGPSPMEPAAIDAVAAFLHKVPAEVVVRTWRGFSAESACPENAKNLAPKISKVLGQVLV